MPSLLKRAALSDNIDLDCSPYPSGLNLKDFEEKERVYA